MSATILLRGSYPAARETVPRVRHALLEIAASVGASQEQTERLGLAVSEAVGNVVAHAYHWSAGEMHVTAAVLDDTLSVVIADDGCGLGRSRNQQGLGLGFRLIDECADQLRVVTRPAGGVEVKMHFELKRPARSRQQ